LLFYKKGCQEKKLFRELGTAKSFGIQPPTAAVQVRRYVAARAWSCCKVASRGHHFPNPPFPLISKVFPERSGAVKGAPLRRGVANP
jgi:hypothetical protein